MLQASSPQSKEDEFEKDKMDNFCHLDDSLLIYVIRSCKYSPPSVKNAFQVYQPLKMQEPCPEHGLTVCGL
jgi:hypothetical protein